MTAYFLGDKNEAAGVPATSKSRRWELLLWCGLLLLMAPPGTYAAIRWLEVAVDPGRLGPRVLLCDSPLGCV